MANTETRRSTRDNFGIPPIRYPEQLGATIAEDTEDHQTMKSRSSTFKSVSSKRKEVDFEAEERLAEIDNEITDREEELSIAEHNLQVITNKLNALKNGSESGEDVDKAVGTLITSQIEAEDKVGLLKIKLEALLKKSTTKKKLINRKRDLEHSKFDSDDDVVSIKSSEGKEKSERTKHWLEDQKKIIFENMGDTTKPQRIINNPLYLEKQKMEDDRNEPRVPQRPVIQNPHWNHRRQTKVPTDFYNESDGEDFDFCERTLNNPVPSRRQDEQVTMSDLVNALSKFGAGTSQPYINKDLPKFGGEPAEWIQFKAEFDRTTRKCRIDDSENMLRLRKSLVGPAKTTVQHLMANVANVAMIIDTLEKRFGRPRVVLNALATKVKACANVTTAKPETIIDFGIAVQALVSNVMAFKENGYLNSIELLEALVKKLSPDLATGWFTWLMADKRRNENLKDFSEWCSMQLDIAYQRVDYKPEDSDERMERRRERGPGAIHVSNGESETCPSCGKSNHQLEKCWNFQKKSVDDRWKNVKKERLCICCLHRGHRARDCDQNRPCKINGCIKVHHRLLHYDKQISENNDHHNLSEQQPFESQSHDFKSQGRVRFEGNIAIITGCDGPLPIVPVKVSGPKGTVKCYALLDTAASTSLIKRELADQIGLEGEKFEYKYGGITGGTTEKEAQCVNCEISGILRGSKVKQLRSAVTVQDIRLNSYSIDMDEIKRKWPYLRNIPANNLNKVVPMIIVGNNNPHLILARKIVKRADNEPIGWRSELGWAVSGNFENSGAGSISAIYGQKLITNEELHNLVKQSFSFEDFGVKISLRKGKNLNEKRAYEVLERTTKKVNGHWETGLQWRDDDVSFPESEAAAIKRLEYTERKMKDPVYNKAYQEKIEEYLSKGYLRQLTKIEVAAKSRKTYVIPHFGVTNPNKPGKFRLVFDAKAKVQGVSLNDKLLKGPDLIRSLVGVLWRFRLHPVALTGDIADMFHRVAIREKDRDSQRILWRDGDPSKPVRHYQMQVMIFGAASSPSSAIFVKNRNAADFGKEYPEAVAVIINDFYVDDCLSGGASVESVIKLREQLSQINAAGNFVVCKWMSNSPEVMASIPEELQAEGAKTFKSKEEERGERVLGMGWNPAEDIFQFQLGLHKVKKEILDGEIPTKREMCGLIMSLFDPIGFISHYRIKGLILLQEVWLSGTGWDDEIPISIFTRWKVWLSRLEEVKLVKVPRCYFLVSMDAEDIQMHTFVDASSEAYCSICYLRIQYEDSTRVVFIGAKAKVAPLKKSTIPRLELQAALLGTRLANSIQDELKLKINSRYMWSDSSTVLQWLTSRAGKLKEFVANRIGEIQESSNLEEWHWIPTKLNIADVATRFESEISFLPECEWFQGPSFLLSNPAEWNFADKRKQEKLEGVIAFTTGGNDEANKKHNLKEITPAPERFSSYWRLVRATAAVRKTAEFWIKKARNLPHEAPFVFLKERRISQLNNEDITRAEKQLFMLAQEDAFGEDIKLIQNGNLKRGKLWRLSPVLGSDGLVRVDGRIKAAKCVGNETKSPIILPPRHHVTELLVDLEHANNAHQGVETVLSNLRKRFWIIDARHTVKRGWTRCRMCHIRKCKPLNPKMSNLPAFRLECGQRPFTNSGIDLFGPLEVTVGRHHEKRWGVLICCMVTRAVHLEVVHSLSTDEIIMALSRFIDTRGRPALIQSDNGTNFTGAAKELRKQWELVDVEKIKACGRFQKIQWSFNPPAAPHMGGVWERLIQTVKKCLMVTLQQKHPKDTTLLTVLKSVENIMNSRPLTHVSTDPTDPLPITPNHLLRGGFDAGPGIPSVVDPSDEFLRIQWKRSQVLADQFWDHWTRFYLPKLIRREKWQEAVPSLEKGALVFIIDDQLARNCWVRGYVSEIFTADDGHVRSVEVMTKDPATLKMKAVHRPVVKVCPLGLKMKIEDPIEPQFGGQNVAE